MNMTVEFILRILAAAGMGAVIGLERELRSKEAGIRTHFLVALGSALFMIISAYGFEGAQAGRFDVARVAAQVVTGIGFLGAGVIIFQKNSVHGLTTAAGLWVTAAIGLGCGGGMYVLRSSHPSPLGAAKPCGASPPFLGSRPFLRANALLGGQAIDWRLP